MNKSTVLMTTACLTACILASCLAPATTQDPGTCGPGPDEQGRWAHDERLHTIMLEMERQVLNYWPQEIENEFGLPTTRSRREACAMEDACWLADGLSNAAARIPEAIENLDMPEADRASFISRARKLQDQACALATACGNADPEGMRRWLRSIKNTCRSCHQDFRTLSGPARRGDVNRPG